MALDPRDPRAQRILKERQLVAEAEKQTELDKLTEEDEQLAKKLKIAESMGLSEAEKAEYLAKEEPGLKDRLTELSAESTPSPITALKAMKSEAKAPTIGNVPPLKPGQKGPFKDVSLYDSLLRSEQAKTKVPAQETIKPAALAPAIAKEEPPVETAAKAPSLMEKLQEERVSAKAEREAAMQKADIGELASIIGRGLAQIGAAASGMRSGVDMSNIAKESLVDWDRRREQIMTAYKQNISEIDSQQAKLERAEERTQDKAEKEAYRKQQLKLEYDKLRQDREIANAKRDVETLSAIAKRDQKALDANAKKINDEIAALDKQEAALRRVEELDVEGKDLKIIAGEVAKLYGKAEAEKPGFIYGTNLKSKDELRELLSAKRQEIELGRQAAQRRLKTIYDYQQADVAPAPTPTPAPTPAPATPNAELAAKEARRQELLRKAKGQ